MQIFEPNRSNYKRKYDDNTCAFCAQGEVLECEGLAGKHWRVLVNQFPYMDGNLMIVPREHREQIQEFTGQEWEELQSVFMRTQEVLAKVFDVSSWNIAMNIGPEAGGSIAHLHWQIIPRRKKNATAVGIFADLHVISVSPEEVKQRIDEKQQEKDSEEK